MNKQSEENYKLLGDAIGLAVIAHIDQFDKQGKPYILHPLHLMNQLDYDVELAIIAVLHDTIEDSTLTLTSLKEHGFSSRVLDAVECLTHLDDETYDNYIHRISKNIDAITVKRKDLEHNSTITRIKNKELTDKHFTRIAKYHKAFITLGKARDKIKHTHKV